MIMLESMPGEIKTIFLAMTPIGELRAAIPMGMGVYGFGVTKAFFLSVAGNMVPALLLVPSLEKVSFFLMKRSSFFEKFFNWLFERTRKKFSKNYLRYGELALVIFVAIPLPVTGVWTGSVAAYLFGIPFKKAIPLLALGVLIAGVIVSIISTGAFSFF